MLVMVAAQAENADNSKCTTGPGTEKCCSTGYGFCSDNFESINYVDQKCTVAEADGSSMYRKYDCVPSG